MRVCNLGSGSDGNLTYIETPNTKILIDAGLSASEITRRLSLLNVEPEKINAILVTHEHTDHIKGIDVFASKYHTKVYVHNKGLWALKAKLKKADNILFMPFDDLDFIIGGSDGLSQEVRDKSNFVLSFGKMVFPHLMIRVMLIEQLYRVWTLNNNHPYHK